MTWSDLFQDTSLPILAKNGYYGFTWKPPEGRYEQLILFPVHHLQGRAGTMNFLDSSEVCGQLSLRDPGEPPFMEQ